MAVGQTIHPQRRVKRAANKAKNEELRAKNQHPKQLRNAANQMLHITKEHHGGLDRAERRYLEKYYPGQLAMNFTGGLSNEERKYRARKLRDDIRRTKDTQKRAEATRRSAEKTKLASKIPGQVLRDVAGVGLTYVDEDGNELRLF